MADGESFRLVLGKLLREKDVAVTVVSAGGKTKKYPKLTDALLKAYDDIAAGRSIDRSLAAAAERLFSLKREICVGTDIEKELETIGRELLKNPSPDFLLSHLASRRFLWRILPRSGRADRSLRRRKTSV